MALTDTFVKNIKRTGASAGDKHTDGGGMYLLVAPPSRGRFSPTGSLANRPRNTSCALNRRRRAAAARLKTLCSIPLAEYQVPVDDDAYRQARPLGQGGLDVEVAPSHLLADLIHAVLQTVAPCVDDPITILAVFRRSQLSTDTQQRRQRSTGEDAIPMPINTILQTGVAGRIGTRQVVQRQGGRVGQDDPVPHHLHPALPITDLAVVAAEDARALRDQYKLARGRVVDRLRHGGDHVARQIGLDACVLISEKI